MRFVVFTHSLISDWNHGNAHFLRGIASELLNNGHDLRIFEPRDGWSLRNLIAAERDSAVAAFSTAFPELRSEFYDLKSINLNAALKGADVVLVHEWNPHELVWRIGEHHAKGGKYRLYFHDTHHRSVTDSGSMAAYNLEQYDGVLAYGSVIRDWYLENGWTKAAWTWHEAADVRTFYPREAKANDGDIVWIGNWGDDERAEEIEEFLIRPVAELGLRARVYGVRYPEHALKALADAGIEYGGWLANYRVPEVFSRFRATVHIPRRPYVRALPGIPTIRPFEALACAIPMISAPWTDCEGLFRPGDYQTAENGDEMAGRLEKLLANPRRAEAQASQGLGTIRARHTCAHRVRELLAIVEESRERPRAWGAD
ncbi:MAG: glycosyltransferase [Bryobacteraceae bacterium]